MLLLTGNPGSATVCLSLWKNSTNNAIELSWALCHFSQNTQIFSEVYGCFRKTILISNYLFCNVNLYSGALKILPIVER